MIDELFEIYDIKNKKIVLDYFFGREWLVWWLILAGREIKKVFTEIEKKLVLTTKYYDDGLLILIPYNNNFEDFRNKMRIFGRNWEREYYTIDISIMLDIGNY